jgi:hypothetical protein
VTEPDEVPDGEAATGISDGPDVDADDEEQTTLAVTEIDGDLDADPEAAASDNATISDADTGSGDCEDSSIKHACVGPGS